eukprot:scaffold470_cov194-Amphora_coffeaeformis.AAC.8
MAAASNEEPCSRDDLFAGNSNHTNNTNKILIDHLVVEDDREGRIVAIRGMFRETMSCHNYGPDIRLRRGTMRMELKLSSMHLDQLSPSVKNPPKDFASLSLGEGLEESSCNESSTSPNKETATGSI